MNNSPDSIIQFTFINTDSADVSLSISSSDLHQLGFEVTIQQEQLAYYPQPKPNYSLKAKVLRFFKKLLRQPLPIPRLDDLKDVIYSMGYIYLDGAITIIISKDGDAIVKSNNLRWDFVEHNLFVSLDRQGFESVQSIVNS